MDPELVPGGVRDADKENRLLGRKRSLGASEGAGAERPSAAKAGRLGTTSAFTAFLPRQVSAAAPAGTLTALPLGLGLDAPALLSEFGDAEDGSGSELSRALAAGSGGSAGAPRAADRALPPGLGHLEDGSNSNSMDAFSNIFANIASSHPPQKTSAPVPLLRRGSIGFGGAHGLGAGSGAGAGAAALDGAGGAAGGEPRGLGRRSASAMSLGGAAAYDAGRERVALERLPERLAPNWALSRGLVCDFSEADAGCFEWAEEVPAPASRVAGCAVAAASSAPCAGAAGAALLQSVAHFEHPAFDLPAALLAQLTAAKAHSREHALHCAFRADGGSDAGSSSAGSGEERASTVPSPGAGTGAGAGAPPAEPAEPAEPTAASNAKSSFVTSTARAGAGGAEERETGGASGRDDAELTGFLHERRCEWGAALESLHDMLQQGQCPYFYVLESDPAAGGAMLFLGAEAALGVPCALLSRSSRGLRAWLTRSGVDFEAPLDPALLRRDETVDVEIQDELQAFARQASNMSSAMGVPPLMRSASTASAEDESRSALLVRGHQAVASLFCAQLNRVTRRAGSHHVPRLVAPVLFANAVPRSPRLQTTGRAHKGGADVAVLHLRGSIMPSKLSATLVALQALHPRAVFRVQLAIDSHTAVFNEALQRVLRRERCAKRVSFSQRFVLGPDYCDVVPNDPLD
jgi:hypothetical protein